MSVFVNAYRQTALGGQSPDFISLYIGLAVSFLTSLLGLAYFKQREKTLQTLSNEFMLKKIVKQKPNFAFIDSQNLNLGVKSQGWKLDWRKFRQYLRNKYNITKAYLFIGQLAGNESLYTFYGNVDNF
jgi:hypothetical protein